MRTALVLAVALVLSATASHATAAISAKDNRTKVSSSTKKLTKEERAAERTAALAAHKKRRRG